MMIKKLQFPWETSTVNKYSIKILNSTAEIRKIAITIIRAIAFWMKLVWSKALLTSEDSNQANHEENNYFGIAEIELKQSFSNRPSSFDESNKKTTQINLKNIRAI